MKSEPKGKKFDAVRMMREIRNKLSEQYLEEPDLEEKTLELIREKYGIKPREKQNTKVQHNSGV